MAIPAHCPAVEKPFAAAERILHETTEALSSPERATMDHEAAEAYVVARGREVMRHLLQGYLDLRSDAATWVDVVGVDGAERTHHRRRAVSLSTVVGDVRVERETFAGRGLDSLAPLDGELNLPGVGEHSAGVRKLVCEEVARGSYDEASQAMQRHHGVTVAKRQAEHIAQAAAVDFESFYAQRQRQPRAAAAPDDIIVLSTDGKGIVMRPDGLRQPTRDKAEAAEPKLRHRVSPGEKRNRKRMALVATVYRVAPFVRKPEDIVQDLRPAQSAPRKRPRPQDKRVWAGIAKSASDIIGDVFSEARRRDPTLSRPWAILVDGNVPQIETMMAYAEQNEVEATIIVDIIHVIEYLWGAAWCFFTAGDGQAEAWVTQRLKEVLGGRCTHVAAGIRRSATHRALSDSRRKAADTCCDYLLNNKAFLKYDKYLAAGLPIATGVIEGACRYLVKDRMDLTGARWSLPGAEAVLRLRALRASGDFEEYWQYHQVQEKKRNHLAGYHGQKLPNPQKTPGKSGSRHLRLV